MVTTCSVAVLVSKTYKITRVVRLAPRRPKMFLMKSPQEFARSNGLYSVSGSMKSCLFLSALFYEEMLCLLLPGTVTFANNKSERGRADAKTHLATKIHRFLP